MAEKTVQRKGSKSTPDLHDLKDLKAPDKRRTSATVSRQPTLESASKASIESNDSTEKLTRRRSSRLSFRGSASLVMSMQGMKRRESKRRKDEAAERLAILNDPARGRYGTITHSALFDEVLDPAKLVERSKTAPSKVGLPKDYRKSITQESSSSSSDSDTERKPRFSVAAGRKPSRDEDGLEIMTQFDPIGWRIGEEDPRRYFEQLEHDLDKVTEPMQCTMAKALEIIDAHLGPEVNGNGAALVLWRLGKVAQTPDDRELLRASSAWNKLCKFLVSSCNSRSSGQMPWMQTVAAVRMRDSKVFKKLRASKEYEKNPELEPAIDIEAEIAAEKQKMNWSGADINFDWETFLKVIRGPVVPLRESKLKIDSMPPAPHAMCYALEGLAYALDGAEECDNEKELLEAMTKRAVEDLPTYFPNELARATSACKNFPTAAAVIVSEMLGPLTAEMADVRGGTHIGIGTFALILDGLKGAYRPGCGMPDSWIELFQCAGRCAVEVKGIAAPSHFAVIAATLGDCLGGGEPAPWAHKLVLTFLQDAVGRIAHYSASDICLVLTACGDLYVIEPMLIMFLVHRLESLTADVSIKDIASALYALRSVNMDSEAMLIALQERLANLKHVDSNSLAFALKALVSPVPDKKPEKPQSVTDPEEPRDMPLGGTSRSGKHASSVSDLDTTVGSWRPGSQADLGTTTSSWRPGSTVDVTSEAGTTRDSWRPASSVARRSPEEEAALAKRKKDEAMLLRVARRVKKAVDSMSSRCSVMTALNLTSSRLRKRVFSDEDDVAETLARLAEMCEKQMVELRWCEIGDLCWALGRVPSTRTHPPVQSLCDSLVTEMLRRMHEQSRGAGAAAIARAMWGMRRLGYSHSRLSVVMCGQALKIGLQHFATADLAKLLWGLAGGEPPESKEKPSPKGKAHPKKGRHTMAPGTSSTSMDEFDSPSKALKSKSFSSSSSIDLDLTTSEEKKEEDKGQTKRRGSVDASPNRRRSSISDRRGSVGKDRSASEDSKEGKDARRSFSKDRRRSSIEDGSSSKNLRKHETRESFHAAVHKIFVEAEQYICKGAILLNGLDSMYAYAAYSEMAPERFSAYRALVNTLRPSLRRVKAEEYTAEDLHEVLKATRRFFDEGASLDLQRFVPLLIGALTMQEMDEGLRNAVMEEMHAIDLSIEAAAFELLQAKYAGIEPEESYGSGSATEANI